MKAFKVLSSLFAVLGYLTHSSAQTVSVNVVLPTSGAQIRNNQLYIAATVASTYEVQGVQATVEGLNTSLVYLPSAYSNYVFGTFEPKPGWAGTISLAGLARGSKTLIVTATDAFGNTNQVQRSFTYDLPPTLTVTAPADGAVARPGLQIAATATDDAPDGLVIRVYSGNNYDSPLLLSSSSPLNTNLTFNDPDGTFIDLTFQAWDSVGGPPAITSRRIYVQSSSNLVEVANVTGGRIVDAQPDRFLFVTPQDGPSRAYIKSRSNGSETPIFAHSNLVVNGGFLSPQGAILVASASPYAGFTTGYGLFQSFGESEIEHGTHGLGAIVVAAKGNFAAWGWGSGGGFTPRLNITDLQTTNTSLITNATGFSGFSYDLASNGDVVFSLAQAWDSHSIFRYRNGLVTLLASNPSNQTTNRLEYPKTDGTNVYYIYITPTNQALKMIAESGESILAEGISIDQNYLLNNGWLAFAKSGGGQMQIWRRSPAGINTQLTFYGTSSTLAALAPNGEVAFYNGPHLYISKDTWPPVEVAFTTPGSGLTPFWQDGRWCATLGRSLFQIYTGVPRLISRAIHADKFGVSLIGARGQQLVTEASSDFSNWIPVSTNQITDGANLEVEDAVNANVQGKFYRLRTQ